MGDDEALRTALATWEMLGRHSIHLCLSYDHGPAGKRGWNATMARFKSTDEHV